jgi:hypothetical protein
MKKTAMQELKSDLVLTKETTKNSFLEIKNQEIREVCIGVVEITLNAIIKRIDTELLEMEKEQIMDAYTDGKINGMDISHPLSIIKEITATDYYNETFKSE